MKSLNHNLRPWLIAFTIAAVIFLLWMILRSPSDPPEHSKKEVERSTLPVREAEVIVARELQHSRRREDSLKQVTMKQKAELQSAKQELCRSWQKLARVIQDLDSAKANADTSRFMAAAEELRNEVESQAGVIQHYERRAEATFQTYEQWLAEKDLTIAKQAELLSQFRSAINHLEEQNNTLITDNQKISRKLKRERTLGRGLGLAIIVLGVVVAK